MGAPDSILPSNIGRYHVVRELGKGAMGRVLLAHDPVLERDVAVKHLRADLQIAPEQLAPLVERMRQEARASARVGHPHLVALHDMGEDPHIGLFLVFEYVAGPTLKERLKRGPLEAKEFARLAVELGQALTFAHEARVVHRDIKPENVILSRIGGKIADFGIARIPDSTLTQGGSILGTPAYSAPEAIRSGKFSPKSDQFSLAATLYEALSGRRAFPGDEAVTVATKIANEEPPQIAAVCGVPAPVDAVLARALAKHPNSRFDSCVQFTATLAKALLPAERAPLPTLPDSYHLAATTVPKPSRALALCGGAVIGIALTWGFTRTYPPTDSVPEATIIPELVEEEIKPVAWLHQRAGHGRPNVAEAPTQKLVAPVEGAPSSLPRKDTGAPSHQ